MKKSVLAIAVAAAAMVASSAVSAAQVYNKDGVTLDVGGRVEVLYMDGAKRNSTGVAEGTLRDKFRLNVKGTAKLTDWATAFGFWENEQSHEGDSTENRNVAYRYGYVGVDFGKFGRLQAGRFEDALDWASNVTDVLEEDGCNALLGDGRASGKIMYTWEGYGVHFGFNLQTAINNYSNDGIAAQKVKGGFSTALGYTSPNVVFGPISVRAAYTYVAFEDKEDSVLGHDNAKYWLIGASWGTHKKGFYVATDYSELKLSKYDTAVNTNDRKWKGFEFVVSYGFDSGVVLNAAYSQRKMEEGPAVDGKMKLISVTAAYNMTPNFRVWAEAHFDAGSTDGGYGKYFYRGDDHNCYMVGARYTF